MEVCALRISQRLYWASDPQLNREGCPRLDWLAQEWGKMVWFTVRDQGGSAGVRCRCLMQQCSGAWPVLCVCTNKPSALQKSYVRAECNSEAEKCLWWAEKKISLLEGYRRTDFRPCSSDTTPTCSWIAVQQWVLSSHKGEVTAFLTVGVRKEEMGIVRCRVL